MGTIFAAMAMLLFLPQRKIQWRPWGWAVQLLPFTFVLLESAFRHADGRWMLAIVALLWAGAWRERPSFSDGPDGMRLMKRPGLIKGDLASPLPPHWRLNVVPDDGKFWRILRYPLMMGRDAARVLGSGGLFGTVVHAQPFSAMKPVLDDLPRLDQGQRRFEVSDGRLTMWAKCDGDPTEEDAKHLTERLRSVQGALDAAYRGKPPP